MSIDQRVRQHIAALADEGRGLQDTREQLGTPGFRRWLAHCAGWFTAVQRAVGLICPQPSDPYQVAAANNAKYGGDFSRTGMAVGNMSETLVRLIHEIDNGLIASVAVTASAETLDDLLEQAKEYHRRDHKEGSSILATAIYEDTIRRIARMRQIDENGVAMEQLIIALTNANIISRVVANRCRTAARVRNSALHGHFEEFTLSDVDEVIRLTGQLLLERLDGRAS